jgi:hypothetical protein
MQRLSVLVRLFISDLTRATVVTDNHRVCVSGVRASDVIAAKRDESRTRNSAQRRIDGLYLFGRNRNSFGKKSQSGRTSVPGGPDDLAGDCHGRPALVGL